MQFDHWDLKSEVLHMYLADSNEKRQGATVSLAAAMKISMDANQNWIALLHRLRKTRMETCFCFTPDWWWQEFVHTVVYCGLPLLCIEFHSLHQKLGSSGSKKKSDKSF